MSWEVDSSILNLVAPHSLIFESGIFPQKERIISEMRFGLIIENYFVEASIMKPFELE